MRAQKRDLLSVRTLSTLKLTPTLVILVPSALWTRFLISVFPSILGQRTKLVLDVRRTALDVAWRTVSSQLRTSLICCNCVAGIGVEMGGATLVRLIGSAIEQIKTGNRHIEALQQELRSNQEVLSTLVAEVRSLQDAVNGQPVHLQ